jgi:poly(3-hydroxyalkanoate) synthetase
MKSVVRISKFRLEPNGSTKTTKSGKKIAAQFVLDQMVGESNPTNVLQVTDGQLRELVNPFGVHGAEGINSLSVMLAATSGSGNQIEIETVEFKKGDEYTTSDGEIKTRESDGDYCQVVAIVPSPALGQKLLNLAGEKIANSWGNWSADEAWKTVATPEL